MREIVRVGVMVVGVGVTGVAATIKWSFVFLLKYTLIFYYKWLNSNLQTNN